MVGAMSEDRSPPARVRVSRLEEVQVPDVVRIDHACAAMYHAVGFDAAEVPVRSGSDLYKLTRDHNVLVVEADWNPAGYAAWRDESPGVAYIEELNVDPELQRFGLGTRLLERIREEARAAKRKHIVLRCWQKATWAMAFYKVNGFHEVDGIVTLPSDVMGWITERERSGRPVMRPGEVVLFAEVGEAPPEEPEPEDEPPPEE